MIDKSKVILEMIEREAMAWRRFGQLLKETRKQARATLREVAEVGNMSISHVSDIEHGRRRPPSVEAVRAIETLLDVKDNNLVEAIDKEAGR